MAGLPCRRFCISVRLCTGHFLSLFLLCFCISVGMAGKGWQGTAWCAGLPAALLPLGGLAEVWGSRGGVCVLAQCVGMYGFCGIRFLGMCNTHALPWWWGSDPVGFCQWSTKIGEGISQCSEFRFYFFFLQKYNCIYSL